MDLVALNGPWQTITFLSFYLGKNETINQELLEVLFYDIDIELENLCKKILREFNFHKKTYNLTSLTELTQLNFDTIWIAKLFSKNPKIILQAFVDPNIFLFEEGLHSYVPTKLLSLTKVLKTKKRGLSLFCDVFLFFLNKDKLALKQAYNPLVLENHFLRCKKKYLLLDIVGNSKNTIVENKNLTKVLEKVKTAFAQDIRLPLYRDNGKRRIMIVGQYFSYLHVLDYADEINIYKQIIKHYLKMDYAIYWKSHPRMAYFEQELINEFPDERIIFIRTKLPAEFYSYLYPDIEYIGISSSALLYKSLIFNGTAYQVAQNIIDKINPECVYANDFREMYRLIAKFVPANEQIQFDDGH